MNTFINYLLEANLGLILFLGLYILILSDETNFNFKRSYLLGSMLISILFPLLKLGSPENEIPSISHVLPPYMLPDVVITDALPETKYASSITIWDVMQWIYLIGVVLLAIRFFIQVARLIIHLRKSKAFRWADKYRIVELNERASTFSFFNTIFIGQADQLTKADKELIIKHETVHVDKFHSVDVLLIESLKIIFWFNPFLFVYKKILTNLHEFQADEKAVERYDVNQYCNLLARVALMSADFKLANHFNNSLTLKRITMMKTIKKEMNAWKVAAIIPIVAAFFFAVACQDQVMNSATEIAKMSSTALDIPKEVQDKYDDLQKAKPRKKFVIIETDAQGKAKLDKMKPVLDDLQKYGDQNFSSINIITPKVKRSEMVRTFMILEYNDQVRQIGTNSKSTDNVFTVVEEPASFVGGREGLMKFLGENLKYPDGYQKIEGKVYVQLVVNTDGSVSDVTVLKSIDAKLDSEAVRVVRLLPKWNPGKQNGQAVRSKFVLPILFKNGDKAQSSKIQAVTDEFKIASVAFIESENKKIVSGKILNKSGTPLAGAHIVNVGTSHGTATNQDGDFFIEVPNAEGQLAVSFVGYETQTIAYHVNR